MLNTASHRLPADLLPAFAKLFDQVVPHRETSGFPHFDMLQRDEDHYEIQIALAGYDEEQISITMRDRELVVTVAAGDEDEKVTYLHQGIARRSGQRTFRLGAHLEVIDAIFANGILRISLERNVPESARTRKIEIQRKQ